MLQLGANARYTYDSELGYVGFEIIGNDPDIPSILKVKRTVLGTERNEFPNWHSYYDYVDYNSYYRRNIKSRTNEILMNEYEWNELACSIEELQNKEVFLYGVTIFNSDTIYTYASFDKLSCDYVSVPFRNSYQRTKAHIVGIEGKSTFGYCIEKRICII